MYRERVSRAVSAGRQLHSRLGNPKGHKGALYSQASLLSKLDRAMAKACSAHSG